MPHAWAKRLLYRATADGLGEAVRQALALNMPISEIRAYLDFLDRIRDDRLLGEEWVNVPNRERL